VTTESYVTASPLKCTATLACEGERGARRLLALASDPEVNGAFGRTADFGARSAVALDGRAITVHRGKESYAVSAICGNGPCAGAPATVLDLAGFFEPGVRLPDGGPRPEPPLTGERCPR